jgi:two-component system, OmpR family, sensor kinase
LGTRVFIRSDGLGLMSRFFLKIYLAVILTLLITGLVFDRVWFSVNQQQSHLYALEPVKHGLIQLYQQAPNHQQFIQAAQKYFEQLNQTKLLSNWQFKLVPFGQANHDQLQMSLNSSGFQVQDNASGSGKTFWLNLEPVSMFLVVTNPMNYKRQQLDIILFLLFYLAIGLGVFLAIRPIINEMKNLQAQVSRYGMDGWHYRIRLPIGSPFKSVVDSFNQMASRIEQLMVSQKELSQAVAHELRTPLARIKFSIESLKHSFEYTEQKNGGLESANSDFRALETAHLKTAHPGTDSRHIANHDIVAHDAAIQDISQDVAELDSLVSEMLDYASFDAAAYQLQLEKGLLNVLLESIAERFANQVDLFECNLGEPLWLVCDWHLIDRAIQNVITNAIKYGNGKISVSVSKQKKQAIIHIDDNGGGIAPRFREQIFESFTRLPQHRKEKRSGFGLGLPIVKKIIELHKGKITIEQSPFNGARFNIYLPI